VLFAKRYKRRGLPGAHERVEPVANGVPDMWISGQGAIIHAQSTFHKGA